MEKEAFLLAMRRAIADALNGDVTVSELRRQMTATGIGHVRVDMDLLPIAEDKPAGSEKHFSFSAYSPLSEEAKAFLREQVPIAFAHQRGFFDGGSPLHPEPKQIDDSEFLSSVGIVPNLKVDE